MEIMIDGPRTHGRKFCRANRSTTADSHKLQKYNWQLPLKLTLYGLAADNSTQGGLELNGSLRKSPFSAYFVCL